jgi:hypothetical protein
LIGSNSGKDHHFNAILKASKKMVKLSQKEAGKGCRLSLRAVVSSIYFILSPCFLIALICYLLLF